MRIASHHGRLVLDTDQGPIDVERASNGTFGPRIQDIYAQWTDFVTWASEPRSPSAEVRVEITEEGLGCVSPRPPQIFAVGLNYEAHADESGLELPDAPLTFTKFASSLTGPTGDIVLSGEAVDWEVELVVVIGTEARHVAPEKAWDHVAGLTVGQDFSDRRMQFLVQPAQFSLGKSYPGYSPIGPWLVTPDSFDDRDDLTLSCEINGAVMQKGRTSQMNFDVSALIASLSAICPLLPGDLIFTGTPSGVGQSRTPPVFIAPGDVVVSHIQGIGTMRHTFVL